jgi:pilus assembly protein CpaF
MHEIFAFKKEYTDADGKIRGAFRATGIRPEFFADLKAYGIEIPPTHFDPARNL